MHAIRKTRKGADARSVPRRHNAYTRAHAPITKGDTHGALMLALFPFLPPGDKSTIRVGALPCMSLFLSFFLSLEGFFLRGDFDGWQTGMRVYLDDLPLLIHGASISRGDEVFERDDDDTRWDRGERRKVHPLVLVASVWLHAKGKRERRGSGQRGSCRGSVVDGGHGRRGLAGLGRWISSRGSRRNSQSDSRPSFPRVL